ncbi:MAG: hypothetical protein OEZ36_09910 [Spirochaetota bacterium]|nr:hypothetical protein [Spirochaetota bacterium]
MTDTTENLPTHKVKRNRAISIFFFTLGFCALLSAGSLGDFYQEIRTRYLGIPLDSAYVTEFCGFTYGKYPGESQWEYSARAFWNMFSAKLAIAVVITILFGSLISLIISIFKIFGAFKK